MQYRIGQFKGIKKKQFSNSFNSLMKGRPQIDKFSLEEHEQLKSYWIVSV